MRTRIPRDWKDLGRYDAVLVEDIARLERLLADVADAVEGPRHVMAAQYREMLQNRRELLTMIRAKGAESTSAAEDVELEVSIA